MKARAAISFVVMVLVTVVVSSAQDKAAVQMEKAGPLRGGDAIAFHVKLNESLPKGRILTSASRRSPPTRKSLSGLCPSAGRTPNFELQESCQMELCPATGTFP